jgi:hypothetical protein
MHQIKENQMKIELEKMDYGRGMLGLLVNSMTGASSLKFGPEDEGSIAVSTRVSPKAKRLLEQFSEIGGVSMTVITRVCIETGLDQLAQLLGEVKAAKDARQASSDAEYVAMAEYDEEAEVTGILDTLAELRKNSKRVNVPFPLTSPQKGDK